MSMIEISTLRNDVISAAIAYDKALQSRNSWSHPDLGAFTYEFQKRDKLLHACEDRLHEAVMALSAHKHL